MDGFFSPDYFNQPLFLCIFQCIVSAIQNGITTDGLKWTCQKATVYVPPQQKKLFVSY